MARLFLIRHTETHGNRPGREIARGILDLPVDPKGQRDTEKLAYLTHTLHPVVIYSSPLQRAQATAQAIGKVHEGVKVAVSDQLLPWNMGYLTGQPLSKVEPELIRLMTKAPEETPQDGQSYLSWLRPWQSTLRTLLNQAKMAWDKGQDIIAVTHSRNIRAARADIKLGIDNLDIDPALLVTNSTDEPGAIVPILGPLVNGQWIALPAIRIDSETRGKRIGS